MQTAWTSIHRIASNLPPALQGSRIRCRLIHLHQAGEQRKVRNHRDLPTSARSSAIRHPRRNSEAQSVGLEG
jgi:hypothetical protein